MVICIHKILLDGSTVPVKSLDTTVYPNAKARNGDYPGVKQLCASRPTLLSRHFTTAIIIWRVFSQRITTDFLDIRRWATWIALCLPALLHCAKLLRWALPAVAHSWPHKGVDCPHYSRRLPKIPDEEAWLVPKEKWMIVLMVLKYSVSYGYSWVFKMYTFPINCNYLVNPDWPNLGNPACWVYL